LTSRRGHKHNPVSASVEEHNPVLATKAKLPIIISFQ
jgi:hypothetical protein